jgi:hypothetical protein
MCYHHHHHLDVFCVCVCARAQDFRGLESFPSLLETVFCVLTRCVISLFGVFLSKDFPSALSTHTTGVVGKDLDIFEIEAFSLNHVLHSLFLVFSELRYCLLVLCFLFVLSLCFFLCKAEATVFHCALS